MFIKFQSEFLWIGISIVISSISIFFAIYYSSYFSAKTQEIFRFSTFDSLVLRSLSGLYSAKLEIVEKTYIQMAIDSLLYLRKYKEDEIKRVKEEIGIGDKVYYGISLGTFNTSDIIYSMFNNFIGEKRWQLVVYYNHSIYHIYGYDIPKNTKNIKSYVLPLPIPDEEIGLLILKVI